MPELFRIVSLDHVFHDGTKALKSISLEIYDGEFIILTGRNGSGKTLLVRHLVGLSAPSSGSVLHRGKPVQNRLEEVRTSTGFVFQETEFQILGQTVEEDLEFGPSNLGIDRKEIGERVSEAVSIARLENLRERRPETLSGGEKRRLAIAGVLAMKPDCVILDEPFANLDCESTHDVLTLLQRLSKAGKTLIVVTHELDKILPYAHRIIVLDSGELAWDGPAAEVPEEVLKKAGVLCLSASFYSEDVAAGSSRKLTYPAAKSSEESPKKSSP
jgi:biotin transport system ATP-binding protein